MILIFLRAVIGARYELSTAIFSIKPRFHLIRCMIASLTIFLSTFGAHAHVNHRVRLAWLTVHLDRCHGDVFVYWKPLIRSSLYPGVSEHDEENTDATTSLLS